MTDPTVWAIIFAGAAGTYLLRLSFIGLLPANRLPARVQKSLRFVPPAVLAGLILPAILGSGASVNLNPANPRLLAGLLAAIIAWRTRNIWLSIAVGLAALWILSALI
jgi:branched-subunit amino acid transport protein